MLTIEALDLNGGETMVWASQQMGLQAQFPNRVELWKRRCHNPLRRTTRRDQLDPVDAESLICLVCAMADRLYMLRQPLEPRTEQLTQQRWQLFLTPADLIEERMNHAGKPLFAATMEPAGPLHRQLITPWRSAQAQVESIDSAQPCSTPRPRPTMLKTTCQWNRPHGWWWKAFPTSPPDSPMRRSASCRSGGCS